jgi:WD40 repeat protein
LLISQSDDQISPKSAIILDVETGQITGPQFWHRDGVLQGIFSPDGRRVITGGEDRELLVWNTSSGEEALPPLLHRQQVRGIGCSPDGKWIGSVSADSITRIWDSQTGFPITPPLECERIQTQILFLPDGMRFATVQGPVRTWLWTLPRTRLSPGEAVAVSHLLNADIRSVGPTDTKEISAMWSSLKRGFPDLFQADRKQIAQWHARKLQFAEARNLSIAAAFHRSQLQTLESENVESLPTALARSSEAAGH